MNENLQIKNNSKTRRSFLGNLTKLFGGTVVAASVVNLFTSDQSKAQSKNSTNTILTASDPLLGGIAIVGFNFAPRGWALCNGQLLSISQNTALFSLLGTTYGGDGRTTFALPDLQGRFAMHAGSGPGLNPRTLGERSGQENVTLTTNQIPVHNHSLMVNSGGGTSDSPVANFNAADAEGVKHYSNTQNSSANTGSISNTGGSQPHNNMPPYLCLYYIIALVGVFPSRN